MAVAVVVAAAAAVVAAVKAELASYGSAELFPAAAGAELTPVSWNREVSTAASDSEPPGGDQKSVAAAVVMADTALYWPVELQTEAAVEQRLAS